MKILLASQSPRRAELLAGMDIPFEKVRVECEEHFPTNLTEGDIPLYLAKQKAQAYTAPLANDEVLLTADTIVWVDGEMLGKPHSDDDARRMLRLLSGKTHQVYTGICLTTRTQQASAVDCTQVTFRALTDNEINYYVFHYRPLDKAGAYGIQEWIGYVGITHIAGSYFNVMGLPVHLVYETLKRLERI